MEEEKAIRTEKKKREKVLLPATLDRQRKPTAGCRRKEMEEAVKRPKP